MTRASVNMPAVAVEADQPCARRGRPCDLGLQARRCEQILDKATQVFAQGYQNTDVGFIAERLNLSKGTIYRYFPSKERLFLAAVERGVQRLNQRMDETVAEKTDPLKRIETAVHRYLEFFESNPALVELFVQERAEFRDQRTPVYFQQDDSHCEPWRILVRNLIAAGRLRNVPVDRILNVLGDLVYGTMFSNHFAGRKRPHRTQAQDIIDVVFNGILTGSGGGKD